MPFVSGFLRLRRRGHPDQGLPGGEEPIDPDYGVDEGVGVWPGLPELPKPPPGIWPPVSIWPPTPLPPDYPMPPGSIWPPVGHPSHPIAPGGPPPRPDQGLPSQKFLVAIVALSAAGPQVIGYTVVDPSLKPDQGLPPSAQPK